LGLSLLIFYVGFLAAFRFSNALDEQGRCSRAGARLRMSKNVVPINVLACARTAQLLDKELEECRSSFFALSLYSNK
jgi:hypothetical protein